MPYETLSMFIMITKATFHIVKAIITIIRTKQWQTIKLFKYILIQISDHQLIVLRL